MHSPCMLSTVMLSATLLAACAPSKPSTGVRPEMLGTYRFSEQVSQDVRLEGQFVVGQDTVAVDAMPGPCRYEQDKSNRLAITYSCGSDLLFIFDRADPVRKARYAATLHLMESRSVCARYTKNNAGQTVCAEYRKETYFRDAHRSGTLRVERVYDVM